jgi:hypothetical protein
MLNYIDDQNFVDYVLEKGNIPFMIRGSLSCLANFNFRPVIGIRITGPTYRVSAIGENTKDQNDIGDIHIRELFEEVVFPGEIELPEKTKLGVSKALYALELWADFLCLAVGNPKIVVEVQRPVNVVMASQINFDVASLDSWASLFANYTKLETSERKRFAGAIWWYRKACATVYYSLFDSYTAYWNCLEILFTNEPHNIQKQMRVGLTKAKFIDNEYAKQVIYQCFEVEPKGDRLYRIRNDINHGNIRENSGVDYQRVFFRGMLLQSIVMELLHRKLGHPISGGMSVNEQAEKLKPPPPPKSDSS